MASSVIAFILISSRAFSIKNQCFDENNNDEHTQLIPISQKQTEFASFVCPKYALFGWRIALFSYRSWLWFSDGSPVVSTAHSAYFFFVTRVQLTNRFARRPSPFGLVNIRFCEMFLVCCIYENYLSHIVIWCSLNYKLWTICTFAKKMDCFGVIEIEKN